MAGVTHPFAVVNDLMKVYPHPEDIEGFPGGKYIYWYVYGLLAINTYTDMSMNC